MDKHPINGGAIIKSKIPILFRLHTLVLSAGLMVPN